jgi:hypothetical protein
MPCYPASKAGGDDERYQNDTPGSLGEDIDGDDEGVVKTH